MNRTLSARGESRHAFTFVEVFAAMVFLAILIPAIVEGLSIANRASVVAERGTIAGELAENKMNEMLADGTWQSAPQTGGDFGSDWPGYHWTVDQQAWDQDTTNLMTQLSVEVSYPVQGGEHTFRLTTLVSGTAQNQTTGGGGL
jgi:type II secretory pathway pseudopilin PulG